MAKNTDVTAPQDDVTGADDTGFDYGGSDDAIVSALMRKWGVAKDEATPSEDAADDDSEGEVDGDQDETEAPEETDDEDEAAEEPEDGDDAEKETSAKKRRTISDDDVVQVGVGDEVIEYKVGELKRLAGQQAALTRKSQEVASLRQQAEAHAQRAVISLQKQIEKAKTWRDATAEWDLLTISRNPAVSDEEIRSYRRAQEQAEADLRFFTGELDELVKTDQAARQQARQQHIAQQAPVARSILTDPGNPLHIPSFDKAYPAVMEYAVRLGMTQRDVEEEVNPLAISVLWKAMKYDAGKAALTTKAKPKAVVKQAPSGKTVVKPGAAQDNAGDDGKSTRAALRRLKDTGSDDAAMDLIMRRFGPRGE